ncbi:MAG: hypothetical protein LC731_06315 [Acidobacteria bacterium]|nr:hypothetical protein [Acidobacteriota bacterium]
MVTVLITSFLLLVAIIYAVYRWQTPTSSTQRESILPPAPGWDGLFGEEITNQHRQLQSQAESAAKDRARAEILQRAAEGDKSVLTEARSTEDADFYNDVLTALVEQTDSDKKLLALVSYMLREQPAFKVNRLLAERFMEAWKSAPDRGSTAKMLHVFALADDAALYLRAVEMALEFWRAGRIPELSAEEFRSLSESEYWILSQNERNSGQGFLLKLKLAALRRELARGATIGDG